MNQSTSMDKLKKSGYVPVKDMKDYILLKSKNGVAMSYKDGNVEGFINGNQQINEGLRQTIEMFILIGLGLTYFTTDITIVNGPSMEPTYKNYQVIINPKSATNVEKMLKHDGSIVRFKTPEGDTAIKRIVAGPGDEIEFNVNVIKVNGKVVDTDNAEDHPKADYQLPGITPGGHDRPGQPISIIKLKSDQYFVIGDNRTNSVDSRKYGPITKSSIISVVQR